MTRTAHPAHGVLLTAALAVLIAPPALAEVEAAWLAREGHLVIARRTPDVLRGFDVVLVDTRRAQPDGSWRTVSSWQPMSDAERDWYARRGELELYRHDLDGRLASHRSELAAEGFEALLALVVIAPEACEVGECAPESLSAGELRLGQTRIEARVTSTPSASRLTLTVLDSGASADVGQIEPPSVELSSGRTMRLDLARVRAASLTPDGVWVVFSVDTVVPIHAEIAPARVVFALSAEMILDALSLPENAFQNGET